MLKNFKNPTGFTLPELLLVIGCFVIISAAVISLYRLSQRSVKEAHLQSATVLQGEHLVKKLTKEIESAVPLGIEIRAPGPTAGNEIIINQRKFYLRLDPYVRPPQTRKYQEFILWYRRSIVCCPACDENCPHQVKLVDGVVLDEGENLFQVVPLPEEKNQGGGKIAPDRVRWVALENLPFPRAFMGCGVVEDQLYCFGGINATGTSEATVRRYDFTTGEWCDYVVGGDPEAEEDKLAPLPFPLSKMGSCVVERCVYLLGGHDEATSTSFLAYHPASNTWDETLPPLPVGAVAPGCLALTLLNPETNQREKRIYLFGGNEDGFTQIYDFKTNQWLEKETGVPAGKPMPVKVSYIQPFLLYDKVVIFSGQKTEGGTSDQIQIYHPAYYPDEDRWFKSKITSGTPRWAYGGAVAKEKIYLIGGKEREEGGISGEVEVGIFWVEKEEENWKWAWKWVKGTKGFIGRYGISLAIYENKIYLLGGWTEEGVSKELWSYDVGSKKTIRVNLSLRKWEGRRDKEKIFEIEDKRFQKRDLQFEASTMN